VHSFSRVFTGAFLDALARMLTTLESATQPNLQTVSRDMGQLLVDGVHLAPITTGYYSQVAAAMVQSDQTRFNGRYRRKTRKPDDFMSVWNRQGSWSMLMTRRSCRPYRRV
jgi:hypothetical protein